MSKQIDRLMAKHPEIIQSVSYEGNEKFMGEPTGDGTWLYLNPGWYPDGEECGTIHEYSIKDVLEVFKTVKQDKEYWIEINHMDHKEIANIRAGKYDRKQS